MAKASRWIGGVAAVALIAAGGYLYATRPSVGPNASATSKPLDVPFATPVGVTTQVIMGMTYVAVHGVHPGEPVYADARGMTLYTYDKDTEPGKSACVGDCLKSWPAAIAPANAKPVGDWSIITRDDGAMQWALKGKPLYTFVKDKDVGHVGGNAPVGEGRQPAGAPKGEPLAAGWHMAAFKPAEGLALPYGIAVQENAVANGQVFVDGRGMTLYALSGDLTQATSEQWIPLAAGHAANPIGDWSLVNRDDGIRQWAYKGDPVYTCARDFKPGDVNGMGQDKQLQVAMLLRYFRPASVTLQQNLVRGPLLATADGKTLYRRDSHIFRSGGHSLVASLPYRPPVGRMIGTQGCDKECLKVWHPFAAPADAQPSGYWSVLTRDDGTRQWSYQGFAMYTYDGDRKPGDNNGNDIFDILVDDGVHQVEQAQIGPDQADAFALLWHNAEP